MNKKMILVTLGLVALLGVGLLGAQVVVASDDDSYPPIVEALVERFGLNEDEVKSFFDEQKQERMDQMWTHKEEGLNQAVADGVITEEQKDALLAKYQEMWEERKQEREQHREEMDAWFEEQGIDRETLREYMGGFGGHRRIRKWNMGETDTQ